MVWCARQSSYRITYPACWQNLFRRKDVFSGSSKRSKKSNTSGGSARSRRLEAAARKAKLEVEKHFLEQQHEMRKLQILKEISVAEAEENVMKRILNEGSEMNTNCHASWLDYQPLFGKMSPHWGRIKDRTRETAEIEPTMPVGNH